MRRLLIATLMIPLAVLATVSQIGSARAQGANRQRAASRVRLMRVVGLADALQLTEAQALRMSEAMRPYDERRAALQAENAELAKVIARAARGDPGATAEVDSALQRIWKNREVIQQLDREMIETAGRDLTAQQRAKMAIFFATFADEVRNMQQRAQERARQDALKAAAERAGEAAK
jgi:hypothetical protein